jgi:hypothetical protein
MPAFRDLTGQRFGRLTALGQAPSNNGNVCWTCECSCGRQKIVAARHLVSGATLSCGCLVLRHGRRRSPEYQSFHQMMTRCYNKNHKSYKNYGERGVAVCDRWRFGENGRSGFECFLADMGPRPPNRTLDRWPNRYGNYEPGNCRWGTSEEQSNNRGDNIFLNIDGKVLTVTQWDRELGLGRDSLGRHARALHRLRTRMAETDGALLRSFGAAMARRGRALLRDLTGKRKGTP